MKRSIIVTGLVSIFIFLSISCSKEKSISNHLLGTWKIDKITTVTTITNPPSVDTDVSTENGSIYFKKDGRGLMYPYDTTGLKDPTLITWINDDEKIIISSFGTYHVDENKMRSQVWSKTTKIMGNSIVTTVELSKQ